MSQGDLYEWEDGRLFVNGEYRAVLESKTGDDGICEHITALCNDDADDAFTRGYRAGSDATLRMIGDTVAILKEANDA